MPTGLSVHWYGTKSSCVLMYSAVREVPSLSFNIFGSGTVTAIGVPSALCDCGRQ